MAASCLAVLRITLTYQDHGIFMLALCSIYGDKLQSIRCLDCGLAHIAPTSISAYDLYYSTRDKITEGIEQGDLLSVFENEWDAFNESAIVSNYREFITKSGIIISEIDNMMRPCPACGSNDTAFYNWERANDQFRPCSDNLKLKKNKNYILEKLKKGWGS